MLITASSTENFVKKHAGGKGYNLYLLSQQGFSVPKFAVFGDRSFAEFLAENKLSEKITPLLLEIETNYKAEVKTRPLGEVAEEIRKLITDAPLSESMTKEVETIWEMIGADFIAVRSSAVDEDSAQHSFAGQLSSYLYVSSKEDAATRLKECWASGYSDRGLSYRLINGISIEAGVEVAVVFQQMVNAERSGVMFTCNPINSDPTHYVINSVYGIGEGLVSGALDADTFTVDKHDVKKIESDIVPKTSRFVSKPPPEGGLTEEPVEKEKQDIPSLSDEEVGELAKIGTVIQKFYHYPQDIEWAIEDGKFYILQSRPVTTEILQDEGIMNVWDNSNIVESYGGLTLPLTFSFAHFVYHQVYVQFCEILSVPQKTIRNMDWFLKNMLGVFYGRVYYNILNWYKLTSILPAYEQNRSFMETMMGTQHELEEEIAERVKLDYNSTWGAWYRRGITGLKFFWFHLTAKSMVDNFLKYFHSVYDVYRKKNYLRMSATEIMSDYKEITIKLLHEWQAPIINDFLCMVHFGMFKKLTGKWCGELGDMLNNDLLCGEGNLESAEPTRELVRMAGDIEASEDLKKLMLDTPACDCLEALTQSDFVKFKARVDRYIDLYGHRCMSEMKLEQKDLHQDPTFLFTCLKNYVRSGSIDLDEYEAREKGIRTAAEKKVRGHLTGWKLWVYEWSMRHARLAVKNRENLRFCRTRIYGVVRQMFYGVGNEYALRGMIDLPEDIFYITLDELTGSLDGVLPCQNLRALVEVRKAEYARYADIEPDSRFVTRGACYWGNNHLPPEVEVDDSDLPENCIKGLGCCPGIVEGTVKVVISPDDDMELDGEILVTSRTDPGWIPLYPSISGLLVERGGLLSHSAIVAREMGLPTVVSIKGLTKKLETGMKVKFDGQSGIIEILE